ncbi:MAG: hypothetical protein R2704_01775 [Microthrixaceae bacterium]
MGTYVALIVLNRAVAPCSEALAFSEWWAATTGDRLVKVPKAGLDHRRFWDAMDQIDGSQLTPRSNALHCTRMVDVFNIDLSVWPLDMTNYATYIDSTNGAAPMRSANASRNAATLDTIGLQDGSCQPTVGSRWCPTPTRSNKPVRLIHHGG